MTNDHVVDGERAGARVVGARSVAVRVQRLLAAALVSLVGLAVLVWYYLHIGDNAKVQTVRGTADIRSAAASEMKLPAFVRPTAALSPATSVSGAEGETRTVADAPAAHGRAAPHAELSTAIGRPLRTSPGAELPFRQSAPVLARSSAGMSAATDAWSAALRDAGAAAEKQQTLDRVRVPATLADALQLTVTTAAEAAVLSSRRWLLPKGSFLDCTLETAIDSTLAGLTTCILATDVYGADGRVVLMERGTKLVGETRSEVRAGQARVAVLWGEARTPTGVFINLASPGTDALGRAGAPGAVDRHTGERFGAAVLFSLLNAAVADFAARRQGSGAVVYNAQESRDVASEVLRNTIAIPPTIRVAPGARLSVTVVRDVDFRAVYELVPHAER
jgi:type IV secretion system protein VirB10